MCLYPKLIINRKYTSTKKNNGNVPTLSDERVRYVPVGCGKCQECLKSKANEWRIRLMVELKHNNSYKYFVTPLVLRVSMIKQCLRMKYFLMEKYYVFTQEAPIDLCL